MSAIMNAILEHNRARTKLFRRKILVRRRPPQRHPKRFRRFRKNVHLSLQSTILQDTDSNEEPEKEKGMGGVAPYPIDILRKINANMIRKAIEERMKLVEQTKLVDEDEEYLKRANTIILTI